jgi:hypothetical protein
MLLNTVLTVALKNLVRHATNYYLVTSNKMIRSNLYSSVLLDPCLNGADELYIVSGYASATFTRRHIVDLLKQSGPSSKVNLIIGMPKKKTDHQGFLSLLDSHPENFRGYYYEGRPSVHCKLYSWFKGDFPRDAFSGSANYSQYGFFEENQANQLTTDNPTEIRDYYNELLRSSILIREAVVEGLESYRRVGLLGSLLPGEIEWIEEDKVVRISFLSREGIVPKKSGLNWGQRLDDKGNQRERSQTYLPIRKTATKVGFLPEKEFTFTMLTDSGNSFDCTVQQQGRKAVATTNNSSLGRYIRERIGVDEGSFIMVEDLERYGRTDFVLTKVDDETFLFDMSV